MAINSFRDFVGKTSSSDIKPYIYVMKYIISKENYSDELKEYILNYNDEESDYEDDKSYDPFMKKLKLLAEENEFDEIEDMIFSYETYSFDDDFDENDEDFEEKLYDIDYKETSDDVGDIDLDEVDIEEIQSEVESSNLSEDLKDFLKIDLEFEDLFEENENVTDIDFEELEDDEKEEILKDIEISSKFMENNSIEADEDEPDETPEEINRPSYLDKLPLFIHTKNGKKPTKKQLENLVEIIKEEFPEDETSFKSQGIDDVGVGEEKGIEGEEGEKESE